MRAIALIEDCQGGAKEARFSVLLEAEGGPYPT